MSKSIDEILENFGGIAPPNEYKHTYHCPDKNMSEPSCTCLTPNEAKQAIYNDLLGIIGEDHKGEWNKLFPNAPLNEDVDHYANTVRNQLRAELRTAIREYMGISDE